MLWLNNDLCRTTARSHAVDSQWKVNEVRTNGKDDRKHEHKQQRTHGRTQTTIATFDDQTRLLGGFHDRQQHHHQQQQQQQQPQQQQQQQQQQQPQPVQPQGPDLRKSLLGHYSTNRGQVNITT